MAGVNLGFELLSTLNEGDERTTLSEVLSLRDAGLGDLELWAVCRECCLALDSVHDSPEMFQSLCVTPDSLAFDAIGAVCFLDLGSDPEGLYIPPEYETLGNSFKAHMYSLGMTLLYASEYNTDPSSPPQQRHLANPLNSMLSAMTHDDYERRMDIVEVLRVCKDNLDGCSVFSDRICQELVAVVRLETSVEEDAFSDTRSLHTPLDMLQEMWLATALNNQRSTGANHQYYTSLSPSTRSFVSSPASSISPHHGLITPPSEYKSGTDISTDCTLQQDTPSSIDFNHSQTMDETGSLQQDTPSSFDLNHSRTMDDTGSLQQDTPSSFDLSHSRTMDDTRLSSGLNEYSQDLNQTFPDLPSSADLEIMTPELSTSCASCSQKDSFDVDSSASFNEFAKVGSSQTMGLPKSFFDFEKHAVTMEEYSRHDTFPSPSASLEAHTGPGDEEDRTIQGQAMRGSPACNSRASARDQEASRFEDFSVAGPSSQGHLPHRYLGFGHGSVGEQGALSPAYCHVNEVERKTHLCDGDTTHSSVVRDLLIVDRASNNTSTPRTSHLNNDLCVTADHSGMVVDGDIDLELSQHRTFDSSPEVSEAGDISLDSSGTLDSVDSKALRESNDERSDTCSLTESCESGLSTPREEREDMPPSRQVMRQTAANRLPASKLMGLPSNAQHDGQTLSTILHRLGSFHESELWALCRECVLALLQEKHQLPAYVSLETVVISDSGHVSFCGLHDDKEMELFYLAPELKQLGEVTEKTCLFGVAAISWAAADYRLPSAQEPDLSEELETLLLSMTHADVRARPGAVDIFMKCNEYHNRHQMSSVQVCRSLAADARSASHYGKENVVVQSALQQEIVSQRSQVLDSIKMAAANLKSVHDRKLSTPTIQDSVHDQLMASVQNGAQLRKVPSPQIKDVDYIYNSDPSLMAALKHVTRKITVELSSSKHPSKSAFKYVSKKEVEKHPGTLAKEQSTEAPRDNHSTTMEVPKEYNSKATHFAPIVVNSMASAKGVVPPAIHVNSARKTSPQKSVSLGKTEDVEKKIKELKKNLMRLREGSLVQDIERDVELEEQTLRVETNRLSVAAIRSPVPVKAAPSPTGMLLRGVFGMKNKKLHASQMSRLKKVAAAGSQAGGTDALPLAKLKSAKSLNYSENLERAGTDGSFIPKPDQTTCGGEPNQLAHCHKQQTGEYASAPGNVQAVHNHQHLIQHRTSNVQLPSHVADRTNTFHVEQTGVPSTGDRVLVAQNHSPMAQNQIQPIDQHHDWLSKHVTRVEGITPLQDGTSPVIPGSSQGVQSPMIQDLRGAHQAVPSPGAQDPGSQGQSPIVTGPVHGQQPYNMPVALHPAVPPFQYHLHQDPRTGLFQIVPIALSQNVVVQGVRQMSPVLTDFPALPAAEPPTTGQGGNIQRFVSPHGSEGSDRSEKKDKSSKRRDRKRHEGHRQRHRHCECEDCDDRRSHRESCRHKSRDRASGKHQTVENVDPVHGPGKTEEGGNVEARIYPSGSLERLNQAQDADNEVSVETKDTRPRFMRVRDQTGKLKRAKSGSSIDFTKLQATEQQSKPESNDICDCGRTKSLVSSRALSKSQPSLLSLVNIDDLIMAKPQKTNGPSPDDMIPSPPLSPSWSKDSGVSGLLPKGSGDATLMERLLNSDTLKHQHRLSRVIKLLREEFAFDGYMENGVEDLAIAEYVVSLGSLKWETFRNAVTEKYCDLYWQDDLLSGLFEAVNGQKPAPDSNRLSAAQEPVAHKEDSNETDGRHTQPTAGRGFYNGSAFRPVQQSGTGPSSRTNIVVRPQAMKGDAEETTLCRETNSRLPTSRRYQRARSISDISETHRLGSGSNINTSLDESGLRYSVVDIDIDSDQNEHMNSSMVTPTISGNKPKSVFVERESVEGPPTDFNDPFAVDLPTENPKVKGNRIRFKSQSSLNLSSNSQTNEYRIIPSQNGRFNDDKHFANNNNVKDVTGYNISRSTSHLPVIAATETDNDLVGGASSTDVSGLSLRMRRSEVAYHWADVEQTDSEDLNNLNLQDSLSREAIEVKLCGIDQQLMMEHRNRRKTLKYFSRLADVTHRGPKGSSEQRPMLTKMSTELDKSQKQIAALDVTRKHLEVLYAEQWGLEPELLYALAKCPGDKPMLLSGCTNPLVQYQAVSGVSGYAESTVLQAATSLGLMAYLYAQDVMTSGFVHQFFYCFRYFLSPLELLRFICDKFSAALLSLSPTSDIPLKVTSRSLDLLCTWLDGYYGIDYENSPALLKKLEGFINEKLSEHDSYHSELSLMFDECKEGRHTDLLFSKPSGRPSVMEVTRKPSGREMSTPRKWESFKAALHLSAKPQRLQRLSRATTITFVDRKSGIEAAHTDLLFKRRQTNRRHADTFTVVDCEPQTLSEQLTLLEQELFQKVHPVHFLNSKAQGITVSMATTGLSRSRSVGAMTPAWEDHHGNNLFVGSHCFSDIIQRLIEHAHSVEFWVAAEIISSPSVKTQALLLVKFLTVAKTCRDVRNYATCLAITSGLDNVIVRHLPAWKNVHSKYTSILAELTALKVALRCDSQYFSDMPDHGSGPVIPSILLFLFHIQQQEIGGFSLANNMCKWGKIRSIAKAVDQIRTFQQHMFDFDPDHDIQEALRNRIQDLSKQDLGIIAAQQQVNSQKISGRKGPFRRMRDRFQGKSDV